MESNAEIGVGATEELSLRVSVAALIRVWFEHPESGQTMLLLERTATAHEVNGRRDISVRANPFGGAVRITGPRALNELIGHFHYDSMRSRQERDFRIQIHPGAWEKVKVVCGEQLKAKSAGALETSPERELAEESEECLKVKITAAAYQLTPRGMSIEDRPTPTDNPPAAGAPTVRVYYLFEARLQNPGLIRIVLANHAAYSDPDLAAMAWKDAQRGGKGRANAVLVVGQRELESECQTTTARLGTGPIRMNGHRLDPSVWAILPDTPLPSRRHGNAVAAKRWGVRDHT